MRSARSVIAIVMTGFLVLISSLAFTAPASAQAPATYTIDSSKIAPQEVATVAINLVANGDAVGASSFNILFDATIVEAVECTVTNAGACNTEFADGGTRFAWFAITGVTSGDVANLTFRGLTDGTSSLRFDDVLVANVNGQNIPFETFDGAIEVETPEPEPEPEPEPRPRRWRRLWQRLLRLLSRWHFRFSFYQY